MLKIIVLSRNYENYISGNYHQDLIDACCRMGQSFLYGPGYPDYRHEDTMDEVFKKCPWDRQETNLIIVSTSWEVIEGSDQSADPHPNIRLADITDIKKVYFLNKEYKNLESKLEYAKNNQFNLVVTVLPTEQFSRWSEQTGIPLLQSHFGINTQRFRTLSLKRKYDFAFTGSLHKNYTDKRRTVKNQIFSNTKIGNSIEILSNRGIYRLLSVKNPISKDYRKFSIYWAEWGKWTRSLLGKKLVPSGEAYIRLINQSKVFLSTLSAEGILGTRFFELMAVKTLILCPEDNYYGVLKDGYNCVMYKNDMSDFYEKLYQCVYDEEFRKTIVENAYTFGCKQTYDERLTIIFQKLGFN